MHDRMERYCELAEYAKKDKSLIPNHTQGRGIDVILKEELHECLWIRDLMEENDKPDVDFIQQLSTDIIKLRSALTAYS